VAVVWQGMEENSVVRGADVLSWKCLGSTGGSERRTFNASAGRCVHRLVVGGRKDRIGKPKRVVPEASPG
jgi:hypothetical protein